MFNFLKSPQLDTPQDSSDLERQKRLKQEKIRKNLRILALCVAGYYFFSAGLSWYKTSKVLPIDQEAVSAFEVKDQASYLKQAVLSMDKTSNLTFDTQGNAILDPDSDERLKLFARQADDKTSSYVFEARFSHSLSTAAQAMMMGLIAAAENNANKDALNEIMRKFDPVSNDGNWTFANGEFKSDKVLYKLNFKQGEFSTLKLEAFPLPGSS